MHRDHIRDIAQDQRPQVRHAAPEEFFLLCNKLGRNLENGLGALMQRLHKPVRRLQFFRQERFVGFVG